MDKINVVAHISTAHYPQRRSVPERIQWTKLIIFLYCFILMFIKHAKAVDLGPLYDCTHLTPLGIFKLPTLSTCRHSMHESNTSVKTFDADVYIYRPKVTKFTIYVCSATEVTLTCKTNFINSHSRSYRSVAIRIKPEECQSAASTKISPYGPMQLLKPDVYTTNPAEQYECSWMKTRSKVFRHFTMKAYPAAITGADEIMQQYVTKTPCYFSTAYCIPKEQPHAVISWVKNSHDTTEMARVGRHAVQQLDNYLLIRALRVGGTIQMNDKQSHLITMDNGMILRRIGVSKESFNSFVNKTLEFSKHSAALYPLGILEAHLFIARVNQKQAMISVWESLCFLQREIGRIQKWMTVYFPSTAAEWVHPRPGHIIHPSGNALLVSACRNITSYKIRFTRRFNGTCYNQFPVVLPYEKQLFFLELATKKLHSTAVSIPCEKRPSFTYLEDSKGIYFEVTRRGFVSIVNGIKNVPYSTTHHFLTKLRGYSPDMFIEAPDQLSPYSVLQIVSSTHGTLQTLKTLTDTSGGDIISGLGTALGSSLESITTGGSKIIKAIGSAIKNSLSGFGNMDEKIVKTFGSATSQVIKSSGNAIEHVGSGAGNFINHAFGNISGMLLWIGVLFICAYLLFQYFQGRISCPSLPCFKSPPPAPLETNSHISLQELEPLSPSSPVRSKSYPGLPLVKAASAYALPPC